MKKIKLNVKTKSKEYPIIVPENSSVAFFELYYELL